MGSEFRAVCIVRLFVFELPPFKIFNKDISTVDEMMGLEVEQWVEINIGKEIQIASNVLPPHQV